MSVNQLKFTTFISKTCSCRTHVFKFPCSMLKFLEAVGRWCYILFLVLTMMDRLLYNNELTSFVSF